MGQYIYKTSESTDVIKHQCEVTFTNLPEH